MRVQAVLLSLAAAAAAIDPVDDERARGALAQFAEAFKAKEVEAKQNAIYDLHDVPHDLVIKQLEKLLRNRDPMLRNVAAMAMGGQQHDPAKAGKILMRAYKKDFDEEEVVASVLGAMTELKYRDYWPEVQSALKDERSAVVIGILDLLGTNQDWRALPDLVEMYKIVMPKRASWSTGSTSVDTGAEGDADQKAAEAAFNKKYGQGGAKEKAKARAKANSFDLRNFATQIRKCVKAITGQTFDNAYDLQAWWVENYLVVAQKIAELEGRDPESEAVLAKAKAEQAALKAAVDEERRQIEEELAKERAKEQEK